MLDSKSFIVFDLDGTLVDSFTDVCFAMNEALKKINCNPLPDDIIQALIGPDLAAAITKVVPEPHFTFAEFIDHYVAIYNQCSTQHTRLFNGVATVLEQLQQQGKTCAVLTNKPEDQAITILKALGVFDYFVAVVGPDTYDSPKPNPKGLLTLCERFNKTVAETVLVGDTETDLMTASNANVTGIAVTHGYRTEAELLTYQPAGVIQSLTDLIG
ncbi:hypothetical protein DID76_03120 [Candidatus Marinamargulisbacteria bacterium SCGC AG-414-C22]|nr:hypothetical protein DID76_03120 [Candidatus Marinamargulisbacteria bacterium SCGC AG-414-C22]